MPRVSRHFRHRWPWLLPSVVCLAIQGGLTALLIALATLVDSAPRRTAPAEVIVMGSAVVDALAIVAV